MVELLRPYSDCIKAPSLADSRLVAGTETGDVAADGGAARAAGRNSRPARPAPMADAWSEEVTRREPQSPLRITFTPPATLRFAGVIDELTRDLLRGALAQVTGNSEHALVIDMSRVEFCDIAGLRALISLATRRVNPRRVTIAGIPPEAHTILHILGWDASPRVTVIQGSGSGLAEGSSS